MSESPRVASGNAVFAAPVAYAIGGRRYDAGTPGFADAIAEAHATHWRPRCLCLHTQDGGGIEMYVARLGDGYIVKRMPNTGDRHAPECMSYEPPADLTGLGGVLGSAIAEDPTTGVTHLRFDFPLSMVPGRSIMQVGGGLNNRVVTDGTRLSLRGLLHYLWDQAELTRWQPGFAGKRSWGTVRRHVLAAAEGKVAGGTPLRARLYVPEVFAVERRDEINLRRLAQWASAVSSPGAPQPLIVMVAEVKEIVPARYGFKLVVKHVPDQAFVLEGPLYRRLERCFAGELGLWGTADNVHLVVIATFGVEPTGTPKLQELALMAVTNQWLPIEDAFERQLVDHLVLCGRRFFKGLRYNLGSRDPAATAILTDAGDSPFGLYISSLGNDDPTTDGLAACPPPSGPAPSWRWDPAEGGMPALPQRHAF